jgi:predicted cobalt transporter CbtA
MVGNLLARGMLVGVFAGLLCFGFLKIFGEPSVERAIAFETQLDATNGAKPMDMPGMSVATDAPQEELVSRPVQAGIGLFTGVVVYSAAFGGLFALAFALVYGRMGNFGPRAVAALLAGMGFVSVYLIPNLKYPANPPSVGEPGTIGMRTDLYFGIIALSIAAMIAAASLQKLLRGRVGPWNATLAAGGVYLAVMLAVGLLLPVVNEVPDQFPATVLWQFRVASLGSQFLMWTTIGVAFGWAAERALNPARHRFGVVAGD